MKSEVTIRDARPDDIPQVHALITELADFEKALDEMVLTDEQLLEDSFGENPILEIIVAEGNNEILGAAMFYEKYSTWKGRAVHLEDFVVKASERRKGIGAMLFEEVMRIAKERNYARMDWQVLDWNETAIAFYKKYGANLSTEWVDGRFTREELQSK
ncbi:GNAT family N-acetyltransferase [Cryomorphaceae bacterium 1068]|nr:GNAT family N-acetyltransferase [Cryomorphaceae bacterium 1068]